MKKSFFAASALAIAVALLPACSSGNSDSENSDSSLTVESELPTDTKVVPDSIPASLLAQKQDYTTILTTPEKKSTNATDSTYAQTASGLRYLMLTEGKGASPKATDEVTVHYRGTFLDGTEFDSSYSRNEPTSFPLNRVIPGWTEGLQLMKEGGKAVFYIPYQLAYGEQGMPGAIPPQSDLIFEVELIKVN